MTATTSNSSGAAALPDYAPVPPSALGPPLNEVRGGGDMPRIAVILGSTRPGRLGEHVARWVMDQVRHRTDAEFELVDLVDYPLPHLDEPLPPNMGAYQNDHTQEWAARHRPVRRLRLRHPGVQPLHLRRAEERHRLRVRRVEQQGHGLSPTALPGAPGPRSTSRLIAGELQMADVRTNVALSLFTDFKDFTELAPAAYQAQALETMLGQVIAWSQALAPLRQVRQAA